MKSATSHRRGFSLVELMIAIMILGLGMVMVATVFPVSLDMTRNTLQMNISQAAFDTAVSTLKLRVPSRFLQLEPYPPDTLTPVVLWPDMAKIQLVNTPFSIDASEYPVQYVNRMLMPPVGEPVKMSFPVGILDFNWAFPAGVYSPPIDLLYAFWNGGANAADFQRFSRLYTEASFWDAEMHGDFRACSWVMASQNILASGVGGQPTAVQEYGAYSLPYIQSIYSDRSQYPATYIPPNPPAIHLADRVYPPITVEYDSNSGFYYDPASGLVFNDSAPENNYAQKLANFSALTATERRYAWTAFARQGGTTLQEFVHSKRSFTCTIALTYRGDLTARYARQLQPVDDGQFNFTNTASSDFNNDVLMMRVPRPDNAAKDTLLPQPWLVMLDVVNPAAGTISCTSAIARLLPAESYLIIAQTAQVAGDPSLRLEAGTPIKITANPGYPGVLDAPASLQIARSQVPVTFGSVAAWVFPPAIRPDRQNFSSSTPVVGTAIREITPDWGK